MEEPPPQPPPPRLRSTRALVDRELVVQVRLPRSDLATLVRGLPLGHTNVVGHLRNLARLLAELQFSSAVAAASCLAEAAGDPTLASVAEEATRSQLRQLLRLEQRLRSGSTFSGESCTAVFLMMLVTAAGCRLTGARFFLWFLPHW